MSSHASAIGLFFDKIPLSPCFMGRFHEKSSSRDSETEKNRIFPKIIIFLDFPPQNPIIHYSKNPKILSNWSQNWIRKSKKVIFWPKPSYPEPWSLLVAFSIKSRFLHVSWPVSFKKAPATIQNPKKINFFPFLTSTTFPGFYRPKIPPKFSSGAARRNWKKINFLDFHSQIL